MGDDWKRMFEYMEAWDDIVGEVLIDDPRNEKLIESVEEQFVNQFRTCRDSTT